MEGAVAVIAAGADEVSEHIVAVGGADQPVDRDPHLPGIVGGQDVAEVSCGDADVHRLVWLDLLVPQQVAVGGDIINDLGQHPAPVDGVGGGEEVPPAGQLLAERLVGKELLDSGLGIVKVAEDRADAHILPLLGDHLKLLDGGDAVLGVEDQDAGAVHIPEALQRPLPSVPRVRSTSRKPSSAPFPVSPEVATRMHTVFSSSVFTREAVSRWGSI